MTPQFLILFLLSILESCAGFQEGNTAMILCGMVDGSRGFHTRQALYPLSTSPVPLYPSERKFKTNVHKGNGKQQTAAYALGSPGAIRGPT